MGFFLTIRMSAFALATATEEAVNMFMALYQLTNVFYPIGQRDNVVLAQGKPPGRSETIGRNPARYR